MRRSAARSPDPAAWHSRRMARLIYTTIASLDGYVNDSEGGFGWAAPDLEVHAFVNDLERDVGTYLCGRRLYETMVYWETAPTDDTGDPDDDVGHDYARIWQAADKVVYSRTLEAVASSAPPSSVTSRQPPWPGSSPQPTATSASVGRPSRPRRCGPASSTSCAC